MIFVGEARGPGAAAMEAIERNARTNVKGLVKRMLAVIGIDDSMLIFVQYFMRLYSTVSAYCNHNCRTGCTVQRTPSVEALKVTEFQKNRDEPSQVQRPRGLY